VFRQYLIRRILIAIRVFRDQRRSVHRIGAGAGRPVQRVGRQPVRPAGGTAAPRTKLRLNDLVWSRCWH
jgi:hypothetical protein